MLRLDRIPCNSQNWISLAVGGNSPQNFIPPLVSFAYPLLVRAKRIKQSDSHRLPSPNAFTVFLACIHVDRYEACCRFDAHHKCVMSKMEEID